MRNPSVRFLRVYIIYDTEQKVISGHTQVKLTKLLILSNTKPELERKLTERKGDALNWASESAVDLTYLYQLN